MNAEPDTQTRWDNRYREDDLPWDSGVVVAQLVAWVEENQPATTTKMIEIGCGTGTNAIWLAERGFTVMACDLSMTACKRATEKALAAGVGNNCDFHALNFLTADIPTPEGGYDFVFDCACFHSVGDGEERLAFPKRVADLLTPDGTWLSVIGSKDGPPRKEGPPRLSIAEIAMTVEPHFEILEIVNANLVIRDKNRKPQFWVCQMRKRRSYET